MSYFYKTIDEIYIYFALAVIILRYRSKMYRWPRLCARFASLTTQSKCIETEMLAIQLNEIICYYRSQTRIRISITQFSSDGQSYQNQLLGRQLQVISVVVVVLLVLNIFEYSTLFSTFSKFINDFSEIEKIMERGIKKKWFHNFIRFFLMQEKCCCCFCCCCCSSSALCVYVFNGTRELIVAAICR